jgi:hypothetical protein
MRLLLLLAPLAVAFAACGGGGGKKASGPAENPLAKAAAATSKQTTEKTTLAGNVAFAGQTIRMRGDGGFDQATREGWLHLKVSVPGGGSSTVDEVFVKNALWLKSGLFASALPAGKEWIKVDLQKAAKQLGFNFKALLGQTPDDAMTQIRRTASKVTTVGTEQITGIETTHYRAAIDMTKIPATDKVQKLTAAAYKPVDVWVDGDDLVRRVKLDYTAKADPAKPQRAHTVMTMTFSGYGDPVDVEPPAASLVVDASAPVGSG